MKFMRVLLAASVLVSPVAVAAQSVVLTEGSSGRPLVVNGGSALPIGVATQIPTSQIAATFAKLCTSNPLAATPSADGPLALESADQTFGETDKHDRVTIRRWIGPSAELVVYEGSKDALKGESIAVVERAYATTGQYGPFKASLPQCNLVVTLADFESAKALASDLEAQFGQAKKMVVKETWADAKWEKLGPDQALSISMTAPKTKGGLQPVHLTAYIR